MLEAAPAPPEDSGRAATVPEIPFPVWLAVLAVALALALALNEHLCARLPLARREGSP